MENQKIKWVKSLIIITGVVLPLTVDGFLALQYLKPELKAKLILHDYKLEE